MLAQSELIVVAVIFFLPLQVHD